MARTRKLTVEILGDASSLSKAFGQIGKDTDSLRGKFEGFTKKALLPATAAFGLLAAAGTQAVNAAMEDAKAQTALAGTLRNTIKATDDQVAAVERYIEQQGKLFGVTDDDLRPAFASLIRVTRDVSKTQEILGLAMDISAGTGRDLESVTDALSKAYGGNMRGLRSLSPELFQMIKDGADLDEVMQHLADTFGGQAAEQAETAAGKMQIAQVRFDEFREAIGAKLLPLITDKFIPIFEKMMDFVERNQDVLIIAAAAVGVLAGSIIALNFVMALNPFVLLAGAIAAVITALVIAYQRVEGFRNIVDSVFGFVKKNWDLLIMALTGPIGAVLAVWRRFGEDIIKVFGFVKAIVVAIFGGIVDAFKGVINGVLRSLEWLINKAIGPINTIISGVNVINPFSDIKKLKPIDIPELATGGIVQSATLALIGEAGPEAVVPLDRAGEFGMGGGGDTYVTINVQGGDPQAVVNALVRWSRQNGVLPSAIRVS
jgi:hypothetical protein